MAKHVIEIDDEKSEFLGDVPAQLKSILENVKNASHAEGFGKGNQKAAEEARKQIDDAIKAERLKLEASMPAERAKWEEIDASNKLLKQQLESLSTDQRKTLMAREETHAQEITKRAEALDKRNTKIRTLVNTNLKSLAAQAGARDESLGELEVILQYRIGYDEDMEPYVKAEDGSPAKTAAGNLLPMDVFVKQYLDNHPHHRKPSGGRGGDARGGASLRNQGNPTDFDTATKRIEGGDRSMDAINEAFTARLNKRRSA